MLLELAEMNERSVDFEKMLSTEGYNRVAANQALLEAKYFQAREEEELTPQLLRLMRRY